MKHRFGLIGRKLGHSWSQEYFTRKFAELGLKDHSYALFELPSVEGLKEWALREGLSGFNVTVPYKMAVVGELDALDEVAAEMGAVNCVTVEDGRLIGHNTDAPAFGQTLDRGAWKLNRDNLAAFVKAFPWTAEVSIGHALISDALYLGIEQTIKEYRSLLV